MSYVCDVCKDEKAQLSTGSLKLFLVLVPIGINNPSDSSYKGVWVFCPMASSFGPPLMGPQTDS